MRTSLAVRITLAASLLLTKSLVPAVIVVEDTCSLADAIIAANTDSATGGCPAGSGADEIRLTGSVLLTEVDHDGLFGDPAGLPAVNSDITLDGDGFAIERDPSASDFRILEVVGGALALENTRILHGGAVSRGAGIAVDFSTLSLHNSTLSGNTATAAGGGIYGFFASIDMDGSTLSYNTGSGLGSRYSDVNLSHSTVSGNTGRGVEVWSFASAQLTDSLVANNLGGGLAADWYTSLTLTRSTLSGNQATIGGGAALGSETDMVVVESTISGNTATEDGGGIWNYGGDWDVSGSHSSLTNSTLSGNSAGSKGGGIYNQGYASYGGSTTLVSSTVSGNFAAEGGGLFNTYGWVSISDSVIGHSPSGANCAGEEPVGDGGNNLDDDGSCGAGFASLTGLDPELADHGGPTPTHALLPGSSAIDGAGACGLGSDQRLLPRDPLCDSGAFEYGPQMFALSLAGDCPGTASASVKTTPNTLVELFQGPEKGDSVLSAGSCSGTPLQITEPRSVAVFMTDGNGDGETDLDLIAGDCGQWLQALDQARCVTSSVESAGCHSLGLGHSGSGSDPEASPKSSVGCDPGRYHANEVIDLLAVPAPSWQLQRWGGTDDDSSTQTTNTLTMPANAHTVRVDYSQSCWALTFDHTGSGLDPIASPPSSAGCPTGEYLADEVVELTASPDPNWRVDGWSGTDDDASTEIINTLTMPGSHHTVAVHYVQICFFLATSHAGSGLDPVASPPSSSGCPDSAYLPSEIVDLAASPGPGWALVGWHGTDDDASTELDNTVTMPSHDHSIGVHYEALCYALTLTHTGSGSDPAAAASRSWVRHVAEPGLDGPREVHAADVDSDGDLDILGAALIANDLSWWENTSGGAGAWPKHTIHGSYNGASSVNAADLDGDGDTDVLGAAHWGDDITWWDNTFGDGSVWIEHVVDGSFNWAHSVRPADIDGDGDPDILAAASFPDAITWWENARGDASVWIDHPVDVDDYGPGEVRAADLDGDGDLDILASETFRWWENILGNGLSFVEHTLDPDFNEATDVATADLDGDNDLDILAVARDTDEVMWWENTLGDASVWTKHTVETGVDGPWSVGAADVDADLDLDIFVGAIDADEVVWYQNLLGDGSTWQAQQVGTPDGVWDVSSADLDGDGGLDLLGAAEQDDKIIWWENSYAGSCPEGEYQAGDNLDLMAAPDAGWEVAGWTGTDDDMSTEVTNTAVMPTSDHTIVAHYVEDGPAGPTLSITGACPGEVTVQVSTPDPDRSVMIFAGTGEGTSWVPWGPCGGTELDVLYARQWTTVTTDENGDASITRTAGSNWCGRFLQGLDRSCVTSTAEQFPE